MGLQRLDEMRSILAVKLRDPGMMTFAPLELHAYLNMGQQVTARRLLSINKDWFADEYTLSGGAAVNGYGTVTLPSGVLRIEAVVTNAGKPVRRYSITDFGTLNDNTCHTPSADNPAYIHIGNKLYIWPHLTSPVMLYIKKPTDLSADSDETIIPVEFVPMIIAFGEWMGAAKAGNDPRQKEQEYDEMFAEEREQWTKDVKVKETRE